ncbi:MAG TPA: hypothetical protein VKM55_14805 [Candidatus Lokiarchaeia archaeon]|nr:hypothetical protein [Candidatus Lokiarchaeia archaeon]
MLGTIDFVTDFTLDFLGTRVFYVLRKMLLLTDDPCAIMNEQQKEKKPEKKHPAVIFEPEAYMKALLHVLRFASGTISKDSWVEVYGWLVGKLENENLVHVYDAVPIQHGKDVEVVFDAEAYVRAAEFDEQLYQKAEETPQMKGYFIVGWYHSHPGLDFFLSPTDVTNHVGFQGPNPQSIAIVFDHTKMVPHKQLGFKIFRLDEATPDSKYHEVDFDKTKFSKDVMNVVYLVQNIVERIEGNQIFTSEIGEVPSIFAHLMLPGATPQIEKVPPFDLDALFDKITKSTESLIEKVLGTSVVGKLAADMNPAIEEWYSAFIPYVFSSMNKWLLSTAEKLVITNKLTLGSIYSIAGTLEKSMKAVNEWTKAQLADNEYHLKKIVESSNATLAAQVQERLDGQDASVGEQLVALKEQIDQTTSAMSTLTEKSELMTSQLLALEWEMDEALSNVQGVVSGVESKLDSMADSIQEKIQDQLSHVNESVDASIEKFDAQMQEHVSNQIQQLGKDMEGMRTDFKQNVQKIADTIAKEKQDLEDLVASKSIKKMQEDLHKLGSKIEK